MLGTKVCHFKRLHVEKLLALKFGKQFKTFKTSSLFKVSGNGTGLSTRSNQAVGFAVGNVSGYVSKESRLMSASSQLHKLGVALMPILHGFLKISGTNSLTETSTQNRERSSSSRTRNGDGANSSTAKGEHYI